jgi:hypothetical protein
MLSLNVRAVLSIACYSATVLQCYNAYEKHYSTLALALSSLATLHLVSRPPFNRLEAPSGQLVIGSPRTSSNTVTFLGRPPPSPTGLRAMDRPVESIDRPGCRGMGLNGSFVRHVFSILATSTERRPRPSHRWSVIWFNSKVCILRAWTEARKRRFTYEI